MTNTLERVREHAASLLAANPTVSALHVDRGPSADGLLTGTLTTKNGRVHPIELLPVRGALGLAAVQRLASIPRPRQTPRIITAEVVGPHLRHELLERGLGYIDAAGNCHLELDKGRTVIHVEGRRRQRRSTAGGATRAAGYRALFAVLTDPGLLDRPIRRVAEAANVSRHAVASLLSRLREEGLLVRAGRSRHVFAPHGLATCIDRFATGWADVLRGSLLIGRFRLRESDPEAMEQIVVDALQSAHIPFGLGGTAGAARCTRYSSSTETTVHMANWTTALQTKLAAAPDRQGPLIVFRTMGESDLQSSVPLAAHPLLIHAELARSPDPRAREAAGMLLEQLLQEPTQ